MGDIKDHPNAHIRVPVSKVKELEAKMLELRGQVEKLERIWGKKK